jgi:hypothetical protein
MIKQYNDCYDPGVPNTCYLQELGLLKHSMSYLTGNPTVVEFGPLFGGSTYALLAGLKGRGFVHSYDCFFYRDWMGIKSTYNLKYGEDFMEVTKNNLREFTNFELHRCDLIQPQVWDKGPIDFIHLDAMKSVWIAAATIPVFFPHLRVGGYVFDQDLGYNSVQFACMALTYYQYRDCLVPVELAWPGTGVLFKVVKPLPDRKQMELFVDDEFKAPIEFLVEALQYMQRFHIYDKDRINANPTKAGVHYYNSP